MGPVKTQECLGRSMPSPLARCRLLLPCLEAASKPSFPSIRVLSGCNFRVRGIGWDSLVFSASVLPTQHLNHFPVGWARWVPSPPGPVACRHGIGWFIEEQIRSSCLSHEMGVVTPISQAGSANKSKVLH